MPNDHYAGWPAPRAQYPWKQGDILIADELNAAIANAGHGGGMLLPDFLPAGQPDGSTDLSIFIQQAIDAAAGHGALVIPANPTPYTIGRALLIPSNTHLIIEAGATIKILGGTNSGCMQIVANASNILIELYGTLDGNASNQTPTQTIPSGGITGNGNVPFSNTLIWGGRSGVITNFKTWPISFVMVTNVEVNGITMSNCGAAPGMGGITTRVNVVTGSYTTGSGAVTLNTGTNPHGIHAGDTFTYVAASGAAAQVQGEYVALTAPDAFTVTAQAVAGLVGGNPSLTTGRVGTCIKSYNSGFVDCTLRNIRDIGLCFYGGVVGGYIRGCDVDAGPLIYSDAGQPGSNIDCELSGNYTHDASFGGPAVVSQQFGISQHNCRVYDNIVRNMARGGIILGYCDGVEVYGNSLHNNAPSFSGASQQSGQINVGNGTVRANIWGNTVRDPGPAATAQQVIVVTAMTYVSATGLVTLTLASAPTLPINVGDKFIVFNILGFVAPDGSSTSYLQLNGSWTAATGTTGSTVVYTAPSGLGTITLLGTSGGVIASTLAVTTHITAGNYSSDASGNMSLTTTTPHKLVAGDAFVLASILSNTQAGNISAGLLAGVQIATAGTSGTTLNFVTVPSLASFAVTSGNIWPANFGISIDAPDYCRIAGNRIGDYQKPGVMTACIGGTWGLNGASEGNYFGPRNQPDPDVSLYGSGVNGFNYDLLFGTTLANNSIDGQVTFRGITQASNPQTAYYPPQGLTPGWSRGPTPHGEVDFFLGEGLGSPGGFDFLQVAVIKTVASPVGPPIPYDPATGIVTLTTNTAHGILPGGSFVLSGITGTDGNSGLDVVRLNGSHVANSDTTGTTLTYTMVPALTVISTAAGATVVPSGGGGGVLKTSVGVGGSLLAGDGYGNTRLGGALVHGAMQSSPLVNGGTVTVNPSTSFVLIQNSTSIAAATIVLPAPLAGQYAAGTELELNFQNPVGTLSWSGASVVNPPMTIAAAGQLVQFIKSGTTWLRRVSDANSASTGGPFLPLTPSSPITATGSTTSRSLQDRAAEVVNVKDFGAIGNTTGYSDGTMSIGSNAFTSAFITFTAADVGKSIIVTGSGAGNTPQQGTITAFISAHAITLSFSAAVAVPWSDGANPTGGRFYYGTDDTATVRAAITAAQTQLKSVYFPPGCYWLASQTTPISLSGVTLRGEGVGRNYFPFSDERGSLVLLSNATTAAFNGVAGTSIRDMAFYYPAIDGTQATPPVLPPLFEADGASNAHVDNWFTRVRVIAADTVFHVTTAGSLARSWITDCLLYGVRNVFWLQSGYADVVQLLHCYFGCGAAGVIATGGSAYLQKYTRTNGAVLRYDIAGGGYPQADGLIWTGGIVQSYRYGMLIVSGVLDVNNISNVNFDFSGSVLSVAAGARIVSTSFSGGEVYSTSLDPAATDNVFEFLQSAGTSDLSITGMRITYALGHVFWDYSGAVTTLNFSANSVSNWGQSTTNGAYYVYGGVAGATGQQAFVGNTLYGNRVSKPSSSIIGFTVQSSGGSVTLSSNVFNSCTRAFILGGVGYSCTIDGNTSIASGATSLDNSTASVVLGVNNFDIAPTLQTSGSTRGINVQPNNQIGYLTNATGSHIFNTGTTAIATIASTGLRISGNAGFNNTAPIAKPTVTGAKGSNAALASLLSALASYGLITDSTTA